MKNTYRITCALTAWFVIIAQYVILIASGDFGGFWASSLAYFGFFTILTNILVALAFSVPLFKPESKLRRFFEKPSVRTAIAIYILVVAVVYYAVLAKNHHPEGASAVLNVFLHLLLPIAYLVDWLFFADKAPLSYKSIPYFVIYPLVYGLFNIIRGALTGFYPYPFVNVTELGIGGVTINMLGFIAVYALGGFLFITLGRALASRAHPS